MAFDERRDYLAASAFRFMREGTTPDEARAVYDEINSGESVTLKPVLQEALEELLTGGRVDALRTAERDTAREIKKAVEQTEAFSGDAGQD